MTLARRDVQVQGVIVQPLGVREPNDFDEAFAAMTHDTPDAILMVGGLAHHPQPQARLRFRYIGCLLFTRSTYRG